MIGCTAVKFWNRRADLLILILAIVFLLDSYAVPKKLMQTEVYFGLSQSNGNIISDSAWNRFVQVEVSKVFSDGFTVIHSDGNWVDERQKKMHTEPSRIISSVVSMTALLSARIDSLREKYKVVFQQESVLRIDKKADINF